LERGAGPSPGEVLKNQQNLGKERGGEGETLDQVVATKNNKKRLSFKRLKLGVVVGGAAKAEDGLKILSWNGRRARSPKEYEG